MFSCAHIANTFQANDLTSELYTIGCSRNNNESSHREKINNPAERCTENDLLPNVKTTNEVIVDFRKKEAKTHSGAGPSS